MASNLRQISDPRLATSLAIAASALRLDDPIPIDDVFPIADVSPPHDVSAPAAESSPPSSAAGNPSEASDTKSPVLPGDAKPLSAPRSDRRSDPEEGSAKMRRRSARQSLAKLAASSMPPAAEASPERVIGAQRDATFQGDWIAARRERLQGAIAFLKSRCILVWPLDRDALVREYRMTGCFNHYTAAQVISRAERMGWEGGAQ